LECCCILFLKNFPSRSGAPRLKNCDQTMLGIFRAQGPNGLTHGCRMMSKVIDHCHAPNLSSDFLSSLHSSERPKGLTNGRRTQPKLSALYPNSQRIHDIVHSRELNGNLVDGVSPATFLVKNL